MLHPETLIWFILGFVLLVCEMLTGTLFLLFFGISALVVGGIKFLNLHNFVIEMVIFGTLGLVTSVLFRKRLAGALGRNGHDGKFREKDRFTVDADIAAGGEATVSHQGSSWTAINGSPELIRSGTVVEVDRVVDGIKLVVHPVHSLKK